MFDNQITQAGYREYKTIVDDLIRDEDYQYSAEPYHDPAVTVLEVLRVALAYHLARRYKKMRSKDQVSELITPDDLQVYLHWVHHIRIRGAATIGKITYTKIDYYPKSPGIKGWKTFGLMKFCGYINSVPKDAIYYNYVRKRFQETKPQYDEELVDHMVSQIAQGLIWSIGKGAPSSTEIRQTINHLLEDDYTNNVATVRLDYPSLTIATEAYYDPFNFSRETLAQDVSFQISKSVNLLLLKKIIEEFVSLYPWPVERPRVSFHTSITDDNNFKTKVIIRFDGYDNSLKIVPHTVYLGTVPYDKNDDAAGIAACLEYSKYSGWTPKQQIIGAIANESKKMKTRANKVKSIGTGKINIDGVAAYALEIVRQHSEQFYEDILNHKVAYVKLPLDAVSQFIVPSTKKRSNINKKNARISFSIANGEMRASFYITSDILWDKRRLLVGGLPQSVLATLVGKPARAVIDHPIADHLGSVKKIVKHKHINSYWISFAPKISPINHIEPEPS